MKIFQALESRMGLKGEISLALVIKVVLLFILWYLFFSDPIAPHLTTTDIVQKILSK